MTDRHDVVVVGAGINGMVAAAELARAGRTVCLIDRRDRIGGFIASDTSSDPGYVHDVFSSWHPLFVTGDAYASLGADLHRHGLEYVNVEAPEAPLCASAGADGAVTLAYRDRTRTAAGFAEQADRAAYTDLLDRTGATLDIVGGLLGAELRDPRRIRDLGSLARRTGRHRSEEIVREVAMSGRALTRREFSGGEVDHLWAPWLLHAGLAPDSAGGGLMLPLLAATMHGAGLPTVAGGAVRFVEAFEALLAECGVDVRTGTAVDEVLVENGRAVGVAAGGTSITATTAVLASVTPQALYGPLLAATPDLEAARADAARYRYGRGAVQLHLALREPLSWTRADLGRTPLVHLSDGSASTAIACAEAEAGLLPQRPTVVVGQQYVLDPTRAPDGAATLWVQLQEAPYRPVGDAAGEIDVAGEWTDAVTSAHVERVLDLIDAHAPGVRDRIVARHVLTPVDLEQANPNAVHGDPYGGSLELDQNFLWRPGPRTARHRTPVDGLWHIGSSTHPGAGLGGGSGHLVARSLLAPSARQRAESLLPGRRGHG